MGDQQPVDGTRGGLLADGVHEGQQLFCRWLWAEEGRTPGEIAGARAGHPTVARAATRMEAAGLLRRAHRGDRRLVRLLSPSAGARWRSPSGRDATSSPSGRWPPRRPRATVIGHSPHKEQPHPTLKRHAGLAGFLGGSRKDVPTHHGGTICSNRAMIGIILAAIVVVAV